MYKHILIAVDGSDVGQKGLEHGLSLAKALGAQVTVVTVTEPFPFISDGGFGYAPGASTVDDYRAGQDEMAKAILTAAQQVGTHAGVAIEALHVSDASPAEAIIETAKSRNCDLITMGSHGRRGFGRLALGNKTFEVMVHCHIPILVIR